MTPDDATPDIVVRGSPSAAELAAVAAALLPRRTAPAPVEPPAWKRAALDEAVLGHLVSSPPVTSGAGHGGHADP